MALAPVTGVSAQLADISPKEISPGVEWHLVVLVRNRGTAPGFLAAEARDIWGLLAISPDWAWIEPNKQAEFRSQTLPGIYHAFTVSALHWDGYNQKWVDDETRWVEIRVKEIKIPQRYEDMRARFYVKGRS